MKVFVKQSAVRQLVFEAMGLAGAAAHPRSVTELPSAEPPIDPNPASTAEDQASPLDPPVDDPEFKPTNSNELAASADKLARRVGPDSLSKYYDYLKRLEKAEQDGKLSQTQSEPEKVADQTPAPTPEAQGVNVDKTVEEQVRRAVRSLIREITPSDSGLSFSGWGMDPDAEDDEDEDETPKRRRKNTTVVDVEGETLDAIAKELGFAAPIGAKALITRASEKYRFMWELYEDDPDAFERFLLMAAREYIEYLESSGELTPEEVELLNKNPSFVTELDGFREFSHTYIKRGIRAKKKAAGQEDSGDD